MKNDSENHAKTIASISRICLWLTIGPILFAIVIGGVGKYLKLEELGWLNVVGKVLLMFIPSMILINFVASGFLLVLGYPKIAHIWVQNSTLIRSSRTWEQLSPDEKKFFYIRSIASMIGALFFITVVMVELVLN